MYFITANQLLESASSGCYAITRVLLRGVLRRPILRKQKSVVSVIRKHVTTLLIKLCDKARKKVSGCGAVGSALPWVIEVASSSLVCYSAVGHAELNAMFHSDQKGIGNAMFSRLFW